MKKGSVCSIRALCDNSNFSYLLNYAPLCALLRLRRIHDFGALFQIIRVAKFSTLLRRQRRNVVTCGLSLSALARDVINVTHDYVKLIQTINGLD